MAHDIEENRFASTKNEWHDRGLQNVKGLTIEQAVNQLFPDGEILAKVPMVGNVGDQYFEAENAFGIYRVGKNSYKFLGQVMDRFEIVQPLDDFARYESLVDTGMIELQTAGLLNNGRKMFITAKVKDSAREIVKNDKVDLYFTMAAGLCGNMTHRTFSVGTRTVCANTLALATREARLNGSMAYYRHTKGIHDKLNDYFDDLKASLINWDKTTEAYRHLANKPIKNDLELTDYIEEVFQVDRSKEVHAKTENKVRYVFNLFDTQKGSELVEANYWKAYNAVTQYLTHDHGNTEDSRLDSLMFGESAKVNQRALQLALNA